MAKKVHWIFWMLIVSMIVMTACAKNSNAPSSSRSTDSKETLTIAIAADPGTLDPAVSMDNSSWKITYSAYERLVQFNKGSTEVKPDLARSWSVSTDGKKWTFLLNSGHKFADGTSVNAQAVKYSFDRLLKIAKGPSAVYGIIDTIKTSGNNKVIFTLKKSFPPFLSTLAANYGSIVNPEVAKKAKNDDQGQGYLASHTMGSGPYRLTSWNKGQSLQLHVNKHYNKKLMLKKIVFKIVSDSSAQKLQLKNGTVDIAENIPTEQLKDIKSMKNVTLLQKPSLLVDYVYINTNNGNALLKNKKVRQALNEAIDKKSLIDAVQQGYATNLHAPIPKGLWGYDASIKGYAYRLNHAKQLLKSAHATDLNLTLLYSDNSQWWGTEALTIQSELKQAGVRVKLNKVAYATSRNMMDEGKFDLALGVWSPDFADPFAFMNYWYDSRNGGLAGNRSFYKNAEVDQMLREAATSNNHAKREKLYNQTQKIVVDDAPYILLYQKDFLLPISKNVTGFVFNPMLQGMYNFDEMSKSK